jgi:hypothetical protein
MMIKVTNDPKYQRRVLVGGLVHGHDLLEAVEALPVAVGVEQLFSPGLPRAKGLWRYNGCVLGDAAFQVGHNAGGCGGLVSCLDS